jgi:hypothetical protein
MLRHHRRTRRRSSSADSAPSPTAPFLMEGWRRRSEKAEDNEEICRWRWSGDAAEQRQRRQGSRVLEPNSPRALYKYGVAIQFLGPSNLFYGPGREFGLRSGPLSARTHILAGIFLFRPLFQSRCSKHVTMPLGSTL